MGQKTHLVQIKNGHCTLLYETKKAAMANVPGVSFHRTVMASISARLKKSQGCHVWYSEPGDVFLVLEEYVMKQGNLLKVLHGERVGWINSPSWVVLEKINHE